MKYVNVILPLGIDGLYTYSVSESMEKDVVPFIRVKVPLGISKTYTGLVVNAPTEDISIKEGVQIRDIIAIIDAKPVLLPQQYKLWTWISEYYMSPLGDVFRAALPSGMKAEGTYRPKTETYIGLTEQYQNEDALHIALNMLVRATRQLEAFNSFLSLSHWDSIEGNSTREEVVEITREELMNDAHANAATIKALCDRGLLRIYDKEVSRLMRDTSLSTQSTNPSTLNEAQQKAYDSIYKEWEEHNVCLLHGVTSSGKTEIYIKMIQRAIDEGKQVLYLLPEIALTVQITERLHRVFGNRLGIYHSKYSDAERVEIWQKQLSDKPYDVILGARSAVFLPFKNLGLVIIDEEHESSFKQQDPAPRYHGRSAAIVLAQMYGAKTLLGTATPCAETYYNAFQKKYGYVTLTQRYKDIKLPQINVVNVKDLRHRKIMRGVLSPNLRMAIGEALHNGEQVILFQNRRGFSPVIECHQCGWVPRCTNCDVSLTYHKNLNSLTCHYCGYTYRMPTECPDCHNPELKDRGFGTEKIEDIIREEFPEARIGRMDLDTTRTRNAYERIISDFSSQKTNLLIGTQMVTKGLDFDHVSVVGILSADSMLNFPDFRAWETAYMMITQVAGRAGRKGKQGKVILQTNNPELPIIKQIVNNDFSGYFRDLIQERHAFFYPPFTRLIYIYLKHRDNQIVNNAGIELANRLRQAPALKGKQGTMILGPDKPAVARIKTLCIRKIVLKLDLSLPLAAVRDNIKFCVQQMMTDANYKSLLVHYDVDPG